MLKPKFEPAQEVLVTCVIEEVIIGISGLPCYKIIAKFFSKDGEQMIVDEANVFEEEKK